MAMKQANAAQKQWMSDISDWASNNNLDLIYDYNDPKGFQLHHVLGRSAKHNKVAIGHWFIIPVLFELHDVSGKHDCNVTNYKHRFTDKYGNQREIFKDMVNDMRMEMYSLPPADVLRAIEDTRA